MNKDVFINRIDAAINDEEIDKQFSIIKIHSDLIGKKNYGFVINKIYDTIKPLSLCRQSNHYFALVNKVSEISLTETNFSATIQSAAETLDAIKIKLIISLLPVIKNKQHCYGEAIGLYYLVDIENIRNVDVLRTYEIKASFRHPHLSINISAATFTPISYHTNAEGKLYKDCVHLPKFRFDNWTQNLTRSHDGNYLKKKHRDKRMSSEMLSLDTKDPSKFWRSKIGVLATFMKDVEDHLSKYIKISFQEASSNYRTHFKERDIKQAYEKINSILSNHTINLINLTDCDTFELESALNKDKFNVIKSNELNANALNLAIHYDAEFYSERQQEDPYLNLHKNKNIIIQSVYQETILKNDQLSRSEYEACKKELLIKLEVNANQLKFIYPAGNWLFIVCRDEKDQDLYFETLKCCDGNLSFEIIHQHDADELFLLDMPRIPKDGEYAVVDLNSNDGYIFESTNYVALPRYQELSNIMKELESGYSRDIEVAWIEEFLELVNTVQISLKNPSLVQARLKALLVKNKGASHLNKDQIFDKDNSIYYKGSMQDFFDWLHLEKGIRLGASLKSQSSGLIESSLGFFYNEDERLYFVGDKDNVKNLPRFCQIRKILTNAECVPVALLQMMEVFHIRHKQATVYPFLFKHLREMAKQI